MAMITINSLSTFLLLIFISCFATISLSSKVPNIFKVTNERNGLLTSEELLAVADDDNDDDDDACVYTFYIRTGSILKGGTDSVIGAKLLGPDGHGLLIPDLVAWGGAMGNDHDYFERGNLDVFSARGPCLKVWPPCSLNLTSDGSGEHHGWYCNYVEVTLTGPHKGCDQELFTIEQWLARDASPYQLYAVRDQCDQDDGGAGEGEGEAKAKGKLKLAGHE